MMIGKGAGPVARHRIFRFFKLGKMSILGKGFGSQVMPSVFQN